MRRCCCCKCCRLLLLKLKQFCCLNLFAPMILLTLIHVSILESYDLKLLLTQMDIGSTEVSESKNQYNRVMNYLSSLKLLCLTELALIGIATSRRRNNRYCLSSYTLQYSLLFYCSHIFLHSKIMARLLEILQAFEEPNLNNIQKSPALYCLPLLCFVYPLLPAIVIVCRGLKRIFFICRKFLSELNESTLSCASDIIVIEDEHGQITGATPFIVRFGFLSVLRPNTNLVEVFVNNEPTNIQMYLQPSGSAYFIRNQCGIAEEPQNQEEISHISFKHGRRSERNIFKELNKMYLHMRNINDIQTADMEKTIYLDPHYFMDMDLKEEKNEISFEISRPILGKKIVHSTIFLWNVKDKIVISDVDGTITKSDVLGHIIPLCSKSRYIRKHLLALYKSIEQQNYRFVYLTMRFHGYQNLTRKQMLTWNSSGASLPEGALMGSPLGFVNSMRIESLLKKSHVFKSGILQILKNCFGQRYDNNIYAGFGNIKRDKIAYYSIGIPSENIYIINGKGHIRDGDNEVLNYDYLKDNISSSFPLVKRF